MTDAVISVSGLTKDYGEGRGIFDINLDIRPGEVFGYLGTNGSGKTTTIRHMLGFLKPDSGSVTVAGLDPWRQAPEVMKHVSYIPGEIAFPSLSTGSAFFKVQARYLGVTDFGRMNDLIARLDLDPSANLKRMSKGMKQKTAIVAALMGEREILILDEPSTGLDPLMREAFLDLIREEKAKGRTIFMSSHIFEEMEAVCDRVAIINNGKIREIVDIEDFRRVVPRHMQLVFADAADARTFAETWPESAADGNTVAAKVLAKDMDRLFRLLGGYRMQSVSETHVNLEQYFLNLYRKEQSQ